MAGNEPTTPSSVEEVLRELERLLKKQFPRLDATLTENDGVRLWVDRGGIPARLMGHDDFEDAQAKDILLDLLKSLGCRPALFQMGEVYFCTAPNGEYFPRQEGKTRSEAVARAVLAVLSQQEREG